MEQPTISTVEIQRLSIVYVAYVAARRATFDKGVLAVFLAAQGLSGGQLGLLQTILFLTTMLTEMPTGVVGDRYGRRISVAIGLVCTALYCSGMMFAGSFWEFAVLFALLGLGRSFVSGSDHALLYDALKAAGKNAAFLRIEARARAAGGLSLSLAMAAGGFLADLGWNWIFLAYLAGTVISMVVWAVFSASPAGGAGDHGTHARRAEGGAMRSELRDFLLHDRKGRAFGIAVLGMALIAAVVAPFYFFAQTAMIEMGLDIRVVGVIYGGIELVASAVILAASRIEREIPFTIVGALFCAIVAAAFFAASLGTAVSLMTGFALIVFASPVFDVIALHFLHRKTPSAIRASALSAASLVLTLCVAAGFAIYGLGVELLGREGAFAAAGFFALGVFGLMVLISGGGAALRPYARPDATLEATGS